MSKLTNSQETTIHKMKENDLWKHVNDLIGQHATEECELKLRIRQTMEKALGAGEILAELKQRWKDTEKSRRLSWKDTVQKHCTVQMREAQRYMRIYKHRELLETLNTDWRDELTLTGAIKLLSENFGEEDDDDDDANGGKDEQDAKEQQSEGQEDTDANEQSSDDSEEKAQSDGDGGGGEDKNTTDNDFSGYFDAAAGSLKKVSTVIKRAPDRQTLIEIMTTLERLRSECERGIKQCHGRMRSLPEGEDAGQTGKRPARDKGGTVKSGRPAKDRSRRKYDSLTGIPANA